MNKTMSVYSTGVLQYLERVVDFGYNFDLQRYDDLEGFRKDGIIKTFYAKYLKMILQQLGFGGSYIDEILASIEKEHVLKSVEEEQIFSDDGTVVKEKYEYRTKVFIRIMGIDLVSQEIKVWVSVGDPYKVRAGVIIPNSVPEEIYTMADDLSNKIETAVYYMGTENLDTKEKLRVLKAFYNSLHYYRLASIPTETVVAIARMYDNICKWIPAFDNASKDRKAMLLDRAARNAFHGLKEVEKPGDVHLIAKELFHIFYEEKMLEKIVYRPYDSTTDYSLTKVGEIRHDRYPIGLWSSEKKYGSYYVKNDLILIEYTAKLRNEENGPDIRFSLHPFTIWHMFTENIDGFSSKEYEDDDVDKNDA